MHAGRHEAALLPRHERPDHALPDAPRRRRGAGLHADPPRAGHRRQLLRRVLAVRGEMTFKLECRPRFDYGRATHTRLIGETRRDVQLGRPDARARTSVGRSARRRRRRARSSRSRRARARSRCLEKAGDEPLPRRAEDEAATRSSDTVDSGAAGSALACTRGRWRETVHRSALALKLLTYDPTGALVAAPDVGPAEQIGGERNWDYRYTWIRDASFTLYALLRLGFTEEAEAFMGWLTDRFRERPGRRRVAADHVRHRRPRRARGDDARPPRGLPRLAPVRIGNGAADQLQLDIYGELIDSVYLYNKYGEPISLRPLERPRAAASTGSRELGPARRGDLGGARRAPGLHLLAAHVLGRHRARDPDGRAARPARRPGRVGRARDGSTTRS